MKLPTDYFTGVDATDVTKFPYVEEDGTNVIIVMFTTEPGKEYTIPFTGDIYEPKVNDLYYFPM